MVRALWPDPSGRNGLWATGHWIRGGRHYLDAGGWCDRLAGSSPRSRSAGGPALSITARTDIASAHGTSRTETCGATFHLVDRRRAHRRVVRNDAPGPRLEPSNDSA